MENNNNETRSQETSTAVAPKQTGLLVTGWVFYAIGLIFNILLLVPFLIGLLEQNKVAKSEKGKFKALWITAVASFGILFAIGFVLGAEGLI